MTVWYKINPNRFTYRELWRMSGRGLWPFAKAVWRKWLDVQTPPTSGFAIPASPVVVDLGSLPERPRKALGDMIAEVERHGFRFVFCHQGLHLGDVADYTAVLISAGETTLANAGWFRMGVREEANFALGSRTEERRLLTRNDPHRTDSPPEFDVWHLPGKSIGDLILLTRDDSNAWAESECCPRGRERLSDESLRTKAGIAPSILHAASTRQWLKKKLIA